MRAALIHEINQPPTVGERPSPVAGPDTMIVDIAAVALNPVDVAIGTGRFYAGHPDPPFVVGLEGVGTTSDGRLVYLQGAGRGIAVDGFASERVAVAEDIAIEIPVGTDPAAAAALGTAGLAGWLSVAWRAEVGADDRVAVLGASGAVGNIAVQAAQRVGARVVGIARDTKRISGMNSERRTVVAIDDLSDLAARVTDAVGGPPTVIIDMLWGAPLAALLPSVAPGARVVQVGASAGPDATLPSSAVRGRQINLLGYSNFGVPRETLVDAYRSLVALHTSGELVVPISQYTLDGIGEAWAIAKTGSGKAVVTFGGLQ